MSSTNVLSSTTIINALLVALANILLAADGTDERIRNAASARRLLIQVFTSPTSGGTLKIACIKFVRSNTDMGLREAKDFVEGYVFTGSPTTQPPSRIIRMQAREGVTDRY